MNAMLLRCITVFIYVFIYLYIIYLFASLFLVFLSCSHSVFQSIQDIQFFNFFYAFQQYYKSFRSFQFIQPLSGRLTVTLLFCQFSCLLVIQYFNLFSAKSAFLPFSILLNVLASRVFQLYIRSFRSFRF